MGAIPCAAGLHDAAAPILQGARSILRHAANELLKPLYMQGSKGQH